MQESSNAKTPTCLNHFLFMYKDVSDADRDENSITKMRMNNKE
jgi:hypothetical protein